MRLIFIFGPVASGKLTVARELANSTGFALFHNHLIVDAVGSVFAFGSEPFVRLREEFWLKVFREATAANQSLIFTFAPEPTVAADFPDRVAQVIKGIGGTIDFVRLTLSAEEQERRIDNASRAEFGKLRSLELLRQLRTEFAKSEAAMPQPALTIDTSRIEPLHAARMIATSLNL